MVGGPIVALVSTWTLYAFGELVEDVHAIRNKQGTSSEVKEAKRMEHEENERKKREVEEKAKMAWKEEQQNPGVKVETYKNHSSKEKELLGVESENFLPYLFCPECGEDLNFMGWTEEELKEKQSCPFCRKKVFLNQQTNTTTE